MTKRRVSAGTKSMTQYDKTERGKRNRESMTKQSIIEQRQYADGESMADPREYVPAERVLQIKRVISTESEHVRVEKV